MLTCIVSIHNSEILFDLRKDTLEIIQPPDQVRCRRKERCVPKRVSPQVSFRNMAFTIEERRFQVTVGGKSKKLKMKHKMCFFSQDESFNRQIHNKDSSPRGVEAIALAWLPPQVQFDTHGGLAVGQLPEMACVGRALVGPGRNRHFV